MLLGIFNGYLCFCVWDVTLHTALIPHNEKHPSYRPVLGLKTADSEKRTWKRPSSHTLIFPAEGNNCLHITRGAGWREGVDC